MDKINVLFVGETWTSFTTHVKGFLVGPSLGGYDDFSTWLKNALKQHPDVNLTHMPNYLAFSEFPRTLDELKKFDVLFLSDVPKDNILLSPELMDATYRGKYPMGPNRLDIVKRYVENGGGLLMCGGYVSFQGYQGIANWHGSPVEDILPVHISDHDDRVDTPEGIAPEIIEPDHPIMKGISEKWPIFLGYNRLKVKEGATLIAKCGEDPFIAVQSYRDGRTMAFASDLSPHWGVAFVEWEHYSKFWYQAIKWLAKS